MMLTLYLSLQDANNILESMASHLFVTISQ